MEGSHARQFSLTLRPGTQVLVPSRSPNSRGRLLSAVVLQHLAYDFEVKVRLKGTGDRRFVPLSQVTLIPPQE